MIMCEEPATVVGHGHRAHSSISRIGFFSFFGRIGGRGRYNIHLSHSPMVLVPSSCSTSSMKFVVLHLISVRTIRATFGTRTESREFLSPILSLSERR